MAVRVSVIVRITVKVAIPIPEYGPADTMPAPQRGEERVRIVRTQPILSVIRGGGEFWK